MKALLTLGLVLCLLAGSAAAQDTQVEEILERAKTERVTLNYSCNISELSPVRVKGKLIVQGDCYYAEGYGMRIYCNGGTRWTIDTGEKEIYVEDAGGIAEILQYRDSVSNLKLSDIRYSPQSADSAFSFDTSALDSSWVVTDLRGL